MYTFTKLNDMHIPVLTSQKPIMQNASHFCSWKLP